MTTIAQLTVELHAAEARVRELREQRNAALIAACPVQIGEVFTIGFNKEYKVYSIAPCARGDEVWLHCRYKTTAGKWSQGTKVINQKVA